MARNDSQLFIIGHDVWAACSDDEVRATAEGLQEFGIFKLPYDRVSVRMLLDDAGIMRGTKEKFAGALAKHTAVDMGDGTFKTLFGPHHYIEVRNINQLGEPIEVWFLHEGGDPQFRRYEMDESHRYTGEDNEFLCANMARFLIVLLATRNIVKTVKENKLAKLGIGKKARRYAYTTTISLPVPEALEADVEHPPTGKTVIPHLRRGHPHTYRYGPGKQFSRVQWVHSIFVNADQEWVATRAAYNIGSRK